ncbi:MAG TPA: hypothetical protein EYG52_05115 [Pseudomonadales bacterium]|jgi:hypothetical protein|nr:hypothetical protein [Gammaproteobacteria bacterium]HIL82878.1 hypothetical protein [Pseudomonadales bacterium]
MKAPIDNVDFGKTASDYLMHRAGFPDRLFFRLKEAGYSSHSTIGSPLRVTLSGARKNSSNSTTRVGEAVI